MTKGVSGADHCPQREGSPAEGDHRRARMLADAAALELDRRPAKVLAFGSQLLHGTVGLNAAERVYAEHRVRAVRVPTILLSVMPHYPSVHDIRVSPTWITDALTDLAAADALGGIDLITAGYFASPGQPAAVADWYGAQPAETRAPLILDPTLGDTELGFYTDPGLVAALLEELVPVASGIVPNLFELAHLSGQPLETLSTRSAIEAAARSLMRERTEWIAVTGVRFSREALRGDAVEPAAARPGHGAIGGLTDRAGSPPAEEPPGVCEILVRREGSSVHSHRALDVRAKGLGDTFTAALVAALLDGGAIGAAIEAAAGEVLAHTLALPDAGRAG